MGDRERKNGIYSESVREMEGRQTLCVIQRERERESLTVCVRGKEGISIEKRRYLNR